MPGDTTDKAVQGDGDIGSYIVVADHASLRLATLTVECWAKPFAVPAIRGGLVSRWAVSDSWFLEYSSSGRWRWYIRPSSGSDMQVDTASAAAALRPQAGVRHHIVGTYSVADGCRLYVNGVQVASTASTGFGAKVTAGQVNLFAMDAATSNAFLGLLDEVAIYNTVLTPAQILAHYNAGRTITDNPVATLVLSGSLEERYSPPGWLSPRIRERAPLRLMVDALTPGGSHFRWAGDESRPENVFSNLRWSSTMPGGHESLDCVLARQPGVSYRDMERFTTLRVIGAGGTVVGEFRLERTPQTSGDQMAISPSAVGWQAALDDNKGVSIIFSDRELGAWGPASLARKLALYSAGIVPMDAQVAPDPSTGIPALSIEWQDQPAVRWIGEATYDSGALVGSIYYDINRDNTTEIRFYVGDNADTYADGSANLTAGGAGTYTPATARRFAHAYAERGAAAVASMYANFRYLTVFGAHGLTKRGIAPLQGFYASDIVAYAIRQYVPLLRITNESMQATNFVILQSAHRNVAVSEIVKQSTRFGLEDWWVWNDKTFYFHPRGLNPLAKRWRARIVPAKLEQTGQQADRLWESILVQWNDVDGSTKIAGPPGSGADVVSVYLKDSDPDNPANRLGMTRRDKLVMGTSTANGAIEVGRRFLEEQKALDRSGRASLVGHVEDDRGVIYPYTEVKAGDVVTFVDAADTSYRRIVKADHDDTSKAANVDLDSPPEGLQAVLERLGVVLEPLGL